MDEVRKKKKKKKGYRGRVLRKEKKHSCAHHSVLHSSPMDVVRVGVSRAVPAEDVTPQKRRYTRSLVALSDTDRQLSQLRTQKNKTISDKSM